MTWQQDTIRKRSHKIGDSRREKVLGRWPRGGDRRFCHMEVRTALQPPLFMAQGITMTRQSQVSPAARPSHLGGHSLDVGRDNALKGVWVLLPGVDDGFCFLLLEELLPGDNICSKRGQMISDASSPRGFHRI
jgi:hypothetical protein